MSHLRIATWNLESRLSPYASEGERGSPSHILKGIEALDSDIVFLPDAFDGAIPVESAVFERLRGLGYTACFQVRYDDQGEKEFPGSEDPHMLLLSRFEIARQEILPHVGGVRNMLTADIIDPHSGEPLRLLGVHLDDRSEEGRLRQAEELVPLVRASPHPTLMLGDFNAARRGTLPARFFDSRVFRGVASHLWSPRMKDVLRRTSEMAEGTTIEAIEAQTTLRSTDPHGRLTITPKSRGQEYFPSIPLLKIDHIYVSPEIEASDFTVSKDMGSDHRAISATIAITRQKR